MVCEKEWCIPRAYAEFVAKMEDVLGVYEHLYNDAIPVECIDVINRQLVDATRVPCELGPPKKVIVNLSAKTR